MVLFAEGKVERENGKWEEERAEDGDSVEGAIGIVFFNYCAGFCRG